MAAHHYISPDDPSPYSCLYAVHSSIPGEIGRCVGSDGGVWSRLIPGRQTGRLAARWKPLRQATNAYGYRVVCFGPGRTVFVHRLVLEAFVGPCPPGMECRHLNGRRDDNRLCNLAWGTPAENSADKYRHGTNRLQSLPGERNGKAKLSATDVAAIRRLEAEGWPIEVLARRYGVGASAIRKIIVRERWAHIH